MECQSTTQWVTIGNIFIDFWLKKIHLQKYKEQIVYLVVGVATTFVDWLFFLIFWAIVPPIKYLRLNLISPNILAYFISWLVAVVFAYFCSRAFVFMCSKQATLKEFFIFAISRFFTLLISVAGDIFFCGDYAV